MTDYANWPTIGDIEQRMSGAPGTAAVWKITDISRAAAELAAVAAEVAQRTRRQFVADTVDVTRVYDGTGTPELEVDDIVTLTTVSVIGFNASPGYPLADVTIAQAEIGKAQTRLIMCRGGVPAWGPAAVLTPIYTIFPDGRQNIQVTGKFGYGPTVPVDLWSAVCGEAAVRLVRAGLFSASGRIAKEQYGDERREYDLPDGEALGWHQIYEATVARYVRSQGKRLRRLRGSMID